MRIKGNMWNYALSRDKLTLGVVHTNAPIAIMFLEKNLDGDPRKMFSKRFTCLRILLELMNWR